MNASDAATVFPLPNAEQVIESPIQFVADDGFPLNGTIFKNRDDTAQGPLALISSAAAVPRGYYSHFARHLAWLLAQHR